MEEQEQTPVEVTPTVNDNTTAQVNTEENGVGVPQEVPAETESKQNNWNNGHRRIEQRQSLKARVKELEARLAQYEGKDDDYSKFQAQNLQERIDDMNAIQADDDANEFTNHASRFFGDETPQFMQNVYRYARYVNVNEPDLLRYSQREYGPILLHEWMRRMDNPALRNEWLQMTAYEKGRVLDNFYQQIGQVVTQYQNRGATKSTPQRNVPVPNGGRQSASTMPSDDFGIELGNAFNRHNGK